MKAKDVNLEQLTGAVADMATEDLEAANRELHEAFLDLKAKIRAVGAEISKRSRIESLQRIVARMTPGQREALAEYLKKNPKPTDQEIVVEGIASAEKFGDLGAKSEGIEVRHTNPPKANNG